MRVLEVQERLQEGDVGETEVEEMKSENNRRIGESVETLGKLIEKGAWDEAGKECIRLRYWMSVKEGLDGWESGKWGVVLIH
jgi:molecular chaperone HscB